MVSPIRPGTVCAVVVTFNRKKLLHECLVSLRRQSRPPDQVLVVDNHSTDGTLDMVRQDFPAGPVLPLKENLGGAGGFHAGMKWAHEQGFEWIWVMDDDIEMRPDTLERMLGFGDVSGFIHVRREGPDGLLSLEGLWDITSATPVFYGRDVSFEESTRDWIPFPFGNFEGALIHRSVIDRAGLPDPRFFIAGDDSIYGFQASFHTNVIYTRHIGVQRKLALPAGRNRLSWYLLIRNRFLMREHLRKLRVPVPAVGFTLAIAQLLWWGSKTALREPGPRRLHLAALWSGWRDGRRGRFGRPPWIPA